MWAVFLPIILLILSFIIKFAINRKCSLPYFVVAILELPVDIMFLASSMVISYNIIISNKLAESNSSGNGWLNDKLQFSLFLFIGFVFMVGIQMFFMNWVLHMH